MHFPVEQLFADRLDSYIVCNAMHALIHSLLLLWIEHTNIRTSLLTGGFLPSFLPSLLACLRTIFTQFFFLLPLCVFAHPTGPCAGEQCVVLRGWMCVGKRNT